MVGIRICLALGQIEEMKKIKSFLVHYGFTVIDESTDGASAIRRIRTLRPDLIIADSDLPGINGVRIAEIAEEDGIAPVIVITNSDKDSLWIDVEHPKGIAFLQRPITKSALLQTIQLSLISYHKIMSLKEEIKKLKETLEDRKLIEKAKGIIMEKNNLSESEAYRLLQKQSMDRGIPLRELARAIILAHQIDN
ncbi:MAG: ANTAR domain-containing protein [Firmicutes bacterium]|nr:ANTAR domain-containing protein [Bacillota bacterium]